MTQTAFYLSSSATLADAGAELATLTDLLGKPEAESVAAILFAVTEGSDEDVKDLASEWIELCHQQDRACMLLDRPELAAELGADGVHLSRADARKVKHVRAALGEDMQIGASCGRSLDRAMQVGEAGADYIAFGPYNGSADKMGKVAKLSHITDWVVTTELPVVAEGGITAEELPGLQAAAADFVMLEPKNWRLCIG
ncbi:MAG: thiamine phosphate synthase [Alphaproteobacteria bacterium]